MAAAAPAMLAWMTSLADATRARLLRLAERHELTVADLCAVLQLPQSTVSRHLRVLADEGWVEARPEGTSRLYRMRRDSLDPAARRLWALLRDVTERSQVEAQAEKNRRRLLHLVESLLAAQEADRPGISAEISAVLGGGPV